MGDLSGLFKPSRVAVIGATEREGSVGRAIMSNLLTDFDGDVVPVNPNYETVWGEPCVADIASAPKIDLAVVAVPSKSAVSAVRELGQAGVEHVVVITAGFAEAGSDGAARERELKQVAKEHDLNLVGPNCIGVLSTPVGLNATFAPTNARPGSLSFLSQSGAVVTAVLDWANDRGVGFKDVVSLGNKAVLDETDFIRAWDNDPGTDVILGYLESIEDGQEFVEEAREVTRTTPIVLLKGGRTEAGARAASSHTGAIAGGNRAYEAGFEQAGVFQATSIEELFDIARVLAGQPLPEGNRVGIVTNAGGVGVLATDAIGDTELSLASFNESITDALAESLPSGANRYNPVDIIGDADATRFRRALEIVLEAPGVDAVAVLAAPSAVLSYQDLAEGIVRCGQQYGNPLVTCLMGGARVARAEQTLREAGIPNYFDPARAVESLEALATYRAVRTREHAMPTSFDVDRDGVAEILADAKERGTSHLGVEAMELLRAYGISVPDAEIVTNPRDAVDAADRLGSPVVMKIVSPDILHKTDIGGVKVGVERDAVADAFEDLVSRAYAYQPDANVLGVQIQELVDTDAGVETIAGMSRDPQFGPLLMFGLGGIFVEVFEDTTFRVAPVTEHEAREMINGIDAAPLLRGARGREQVAIDPLIESIQRLSQLVCDFPAILELDINPLVAAPDGVTAVDLRITVDPEQL